MQRGALFFGKTQISMEFPSSDSEVIPGVVWGSIDAFPSPAYWAFQVLCRRVEGDTINYQLGNTLKEEVGACLLGGHGIPASVGLAAYRYVKAHQVFEGVPPREEKIFEILSQPIEVDGRFIRYRFAKQKSRYLACALEYVHGSKVPNSGRALRDWLLAVPGIGYKTASWIARNFLRANDVAILDIHIFRAGVLGGFFNANLSVEKNYLELEEAFISLSKGLEVQASELDAVIWKEMMESPETVHQIMASIPSLSGAGNQKSFKRTQKRHTNSEQFALLT